MNNKTLWIGIVVVLLLIGVYVIARTPNANNTSSEQENGERSSAEGRVVFSVTDAAADMEAISEISMKISKVEMHNNVEGWVNVSSTPRTYNLLELNASGESKVLADAKATAGTYNQIRLVVDSISVKTKAGATKEAKLPSGEIKMNTVLVVKGGTTSSVNFDFLADKSLHVTGNGEYIFAPVVKTETKSEANVSVNGSGTVSIGGGNVDDSNTVGMDLDGNVRIDFQVDSAQKIKLDSNGKIDIEGLLK